MSSVLPAYIVADTSASMYGASVPLKNALSQLLNQFTENPALADKVRLGVIAYSSSARVVLPLSNLTTITSLPEFTFGGDTSWTAAFEKLHETILEDVGQLRKDDFSVQRPLVFFYSDGIPTDSDKSWRGALESLRSIRAHPNIISFGLGDADPGLIRDVSSTSSWSFMGATDTELEVLFTQIMRYVVSSLTSVTSSAHEGYLAAPLSPPGASLYQVPPEII